MTEQVIKLCNLKELYIAAGRCLLTDNYEYYNGLYNRGFTEALYSLIWELLSVSGYIALADSIGCCENHIYQMLYDKLSEENTIYIYCDEYIAGKLSAIYCPDKNIYIFSALTDCHPDVPVIRLDGCYYSTDRRKYSPAQYRKLAEYYYEKSEYIDKEIPL